MHWYDILFYLILLGLLAWYSPRAALWTLLTVCVTTLLVAGLLLHPGVVIGMIVILILYTVFMHLMD